MAVELELLDGKDPTRVRLASDAVLGRGNACGLKISSRMVSRRHAELKVGGDDLRVRDLGSRNGTFVDGRRLDDGELAAVPVGSELSLGGVRFRLVSLGGAFAMPVRRRSSPPPPVRQMAAVPVTDGPDAADGDAPEQTATVTTPVNHDGPPPSAEPVTVSAADPVVSDAPPAAGAPADDVPTDEADTVPHLIADDAPSDVVDDGDLHDLPSAGEDDVDADDLPRGDAPSLIDPDDLALAALRDDDGGSDGDAADDDSELSNFLSHFGD